jgi:hypothetical protein
MFDRFGVMGKIFPSVESDLQLERTPTRTPVRVNHSKWRSMRFPPMIRVLAVRRRAWGPLVAYPPLMSSIFFTEALNEICDSI